MLEEDKGEFSFSEINLEDTGVPCFRYTSITSDRIILARFPISE